MANKGITEYDVHRTADALFADTGESPTNLDVLNHLGTGSATTINKHMQTWRNNNSETMASRRHKAAITKGLAALMDELDVTVKKEYTNQLESLRAKHAEQEASLEQLSNTVNDLRDNIELKENELKELTRQSESLANENSLHKNEINQKSSKIKELSIFLSERDMALYEHGELSKELKAERDKFIEESRAHSIDAATLREVNKGLVDKCETALQRLALSEEKNHVANTRSQQLEADYDELNVTNKQIQNTLGIRNNDLISEIKELRDQLSPLSSSVVELNTENAVLTQKLVAALDKLTGVDEQLSQFKHSAKRDSELIQALQNQLKDVAEKMKKQTKEQSIKNKEK
jgi:chromosome segregation ATPase